MTDAFDMMSVAHIWDDSTEQSDTRIVPDEIVLYMGEMYVSTYIVDERSLCVKCDLYQPCILNRKFMTKPFLCDPELHLKRVNP